MRESEGKDARHSGEGSGTDETAMWWYTRHVPRAVRHTVWLTPEKSEKELG